MTVILLLLVVFGVVLVMRLTRSGPDEQIASAVEPGRRQAQPAARPAAIRCSRRPEVQTAVGSGADGGPGESGADQAAEDLRQRSRSVEACRR